MQPLSRDILERSPRLRRATYRALFAVVPLVPLRLCHLAAYLIAVVAWFVDHRGRRTVGANLAPLIASRSHGPLRRAVRRSYICFAFSMAEGLHLHRLPPRLLRAPGLRITDPWGVLAQPPLRGPAIMVTLHVNWELSPALLHQRGELEQLHALSLSHGDELIDALYDRYREAAGVRSLWLDRAPLASLRALGRDAVLGIVGDRDYSSNGVAVRVCGRELRIPVGPAALAVQSGAPVRPTVLMRRGTSGFHMLLGRPIVARHDAPKRREIARICDELAMWYERCLRAAPAQWVAFHPVWGGGAGVPGSPPTWV